MLKNHNHDLVQELSEVSDGLWRMDEYKKNAEGCSHCENLWADTKKKLDEVSNMLVKEINRHVQENRFE